MKTVVRAEGEHDEYFSLAFEPSRFVAFTTTPWRKKEEPKILSQGHEGGSLLRVNEWDYLYYESNIC